MGLHELKAPRGARRPHRRRGLGDSAGQGSYSGRGFKGQRKRESVRPLFEGGQNKLVKRLPYMRGFHNLFRTEYVPVNLGRLSAFEPGVEITPAVLLERGIVNHAGAPIKILGEGDAPSGVKVSIHAVSASAKAKIEAAGGSVTLLIAPKEPVESSHIPDRKRRAKAAAPASTRGRGSAQAQEEAKSAEGEKAQGGASPSSTEGGAKPKGGRKQRPESSAKAEPESESKGA
ncbi:MAG: 50S ribosomal protein L15 [Chloroflexi bacterium]|nr:50S ribosomal protein L15 [Chloroflexota bacterium]